MGKETGFCIRCAPCPNEEDGEQLQKMCQQAYDDCMFWCETLKPSEYSTNYKLKQEYLDEFGSTCHKLVMVAESSQTNDPKPLTSRSSTKSPMTTRSPTKTSKKSPRTTRSPTKTFSAKVLPAGENKRNFKLHVGAAIGVCTAFLLIGVFALIKWLLRKPDKGIYNSYDSLKSFRRQMPHFKFPVCDHTHAGSMLTLKCITGVHLDPLFRFSRLLFKRVKIFLPLFLFFFF